MKKTFYRSIIVVTCLVSLFFCFSFMMTKVWLLSNDASADNVILATNSQDEKNKAEVDGNLTSQDSQNIQTKESKENTNNDNTQKIDSNSEVNLGKQINNSKVIDNYSNKTIDNGLILDQAIKKNNILNIDPGNNYIEFSSDESFSLESPAKTWDGTIYYYDFSSSVWKEWEGEMIDSVKLTQSSKEAIRITGLDNKEIIGDIGSITPWQIQAPDGSVDCKGDFRHLLKFNLDATFQPEMNTYCFSHMFYECSALKSAPDLSMAKLSTFCYKAMFAGCNNLETMPVLPALDLVESCYDEMFAGCSKLKAATPLNAGKNSGNLGYACYSKMFEDCISLEEAPELPATELTGSCYSSMFRGCTSLQNTPELPAKNLHKSCYEGMFWGCTKLLTPADMNHVISLAGYCCNYMYKDCSSISVYLKKSGLYTKEWKFNVEESPSEWAKSMLEGTKGPFKSTPVLNSSYYIYEKPYNLVAFYSDNVFTVSATKTWDGTIEVSTDGVGWKTWDGTAISPTAETLKYVLFRGTGNTVITGETGQSWTIAGSDVSCEGVLDNLLDYSKVAQQQYPTIGEYAFKDMFKNQQAITMGPTFYGLQLSKSCYQGMFEGCTNLKTVPKLQATSLAEACYKQMFKDCTTLTTADELVCTKLEKSCYEEMYSGCSGLTTAISLPAEELAESCYLGMFKDCTKILSPTSLSSVTKLALDCCKEMYSGCSEMVVNTESSGLYCVEWRVNADDIAGGWSTDMFTNTKGDFKGSPLVNTSYYTSQGPLNCITISSDKPFSVYTVKQWNGNLYYSTDAQSWTTMSTGYYESSTSAGSNVLYIRGTDNSLITGVNGQPWKFYLSDGAEGLSVSGNIENILDYRRVDVQEHPVMVEGCFANLFKECILLKSAPSLPSPTLSNKCYYQMFQNCISLSETPELPAAQMVEGCYYDMFSGCVSLVNAPALSSAQLAPYCYAGMFSDCASLANVPQVLPSTQAPENCYDSMFKNCISLLTAPELSATELSADCFAYMFSGCEMLETTPKLNATELAKNCYKYMFYGCKAINNISYLPANTLADSCYYGMFQNCTNLVSCPTLASSDLAPSCYKLMFAGCSSINSVSDLPAGNMTYSCYESMFEGCQALSEMPSLLSTNLAPSCYKNMFANCYKITVPSALPATQLADSCYSHMFEGCGSIIRPVDLSHVTQLAPSCCASMFLNCNLLKVYNEPFSEYTHAWKVSENLEYVQFWASDMFTGTGGDFTGTPEIGKEYYVFKMEQGYLTFSCASSFTISADKKWDGKILYSYDSKNWNDSWDGNQITSELDEVSNEYRLYFKGLNNTVITGNSTFGLTPQWYLTISHYLPTPIDISVSGNIENLLDAESIAEGKHPVMDEYCFANMFKDWTELVIGPSLRANILSPYCYYSMFQNCNNLTSTPSLNAISLEEGCYQSMFDGCTHLVCPADMSKVSSLASNCCKEMYKGCSNMQIRKEVREPYSKNWIVNAKLPEGSSQSWSSDMFLNTMPESQITTPEVGVNYYVLQQSNSFLTFTSKAGFSMQRNFNCNGKVYYSLDGFNWSTWDDGDVINAQIDEDQYYNLYLTGSGNNYVKCKDASLASDGGIIMVSKAAEPSTVSCYGNIESLLNNTSVTEGKHPSMNNYCFQGLFRNCAVLDTAPEMLGTTLSEYCYNQMYSGCKSLKAAPSLPSTCLQNWSYADMFRDCESLEYSPDLPCYNDLDEACYFGMFAGCKSLKNAPALPSTNIKYNYAYKYMFQNCTSLEKPPSLPGLSLTDECYAYMFEGCTSLTSMPALPSTSLDYACYQGMFKSCTSLQNVVDLPASSTPSYSYSEMFKGCASMITAPQISSTKLSDHCYSEMFADCKSLLNPPALPVNCLQEYCYNMMFAGCSSLVNAPALPSYNDIDHHCYFGMFTNCTSLETAPALPSTSFKAGDYHGWVYAQMFMGCTKLVNAPVLPCTTMTEACYELMFAGCTSLVTAPQLPANSLDQWCYKSMFNGCTSLVDPPTLNSNSMQDECYYYMFYGCTSLQFPPALPCYNSLDQKCYFGMFEGCTSLLTCPELPSTDFESYWGTDYEYVYAYMFKGCTSLKYGPVLPCIDIQQYCYEGMFENCTGLLECPELPSDDTDTACYRFMFRGCTSLTKMPYLPEDSVPSYAYQSMFEGCTNLIEVTPLNGSLNTACYQYMFKDCTSLVQPPALANKGTAECCFEGMFQGCTKLAQAPSFSWNNSSNYCYKNMFRDCVCLTQIPDMSKTNMTRTECCVEMFSGCSSLQIYATDDLESTRKHWVAPSNVNQECVANMFNGTGGDNIDPITANTTYYLANGKPYAILYSDGQLDIQTVADTSSIPATATAYPLEDFLVKETITETDIPWHSQRSSITGVSVKTTIKPAKSVSYWFKNLSQCKSIQLNYLDTSEVTQMAELFYGCSSLVSLDLSKFSTKKIVDATSGSSVFAGCTSLSTIVLGDQWTFNGSTGSRIEGLNFLPPPTTGSYIENKWLVTNGSNKWKNYDYWNIPNNKNSTYAWYKKSSVNINCFNFTGYEGPYDGASHPANVTAKTDIGVGEVTKVSYYKDGASEPITGEPLETGSYNVRVSGNAGDNYSEYVDFTTAAWRVIINPVPLNETMVYGLENSYEYTGSNIEPEIQIKTTETADPLIKDQDYTVEYGENLNVGEGTVKIIGKGIYTGDIDLVFSITKAQNEILSINIDDVYFNQRPRPTLTAKFGSEGEFKYSKNQEGPYGAWDTGNPPGEYWVEATVYGSDNWESATDTKAFHVVTRDMEVSVSSYTYTYDGQPHLLGEVDVTDPSGGVAQIRYREEPTGAYNLDKVPSKVEAGTYTVYFIATATSYNNYEGSFNCVINPKDIPVNSGIKAIDRVFDSTTDVQLDVSDAVLGDIVGTDEVHVFSAVGTMDDFNSGKDKIVHISDIVLDGKDVKNYICSATEGQTTTTVNIAKAKADVPIAKTGLIYNGQEQIGVPLPAGAVYAISDNTKKDANSDYLATASLDDKGNYEWNLETPTSDDQYITWFIAKKQIDVKADNKSSIEDAELVELTYKGDTLFSGDSYTGSLATDADINVPKDYDITQGTLTAGNNYEINYTKGIYSVLPKKTQIIEFSGVPGGKVDKTYGDEPFTEIVTGAKTPVTYSSGDTSIADVDSSTGQVTLKKSGTTVITATAAETADYYSATATYTLNVAKYSPVITIDSRTEFAYNTEEFLTYSYDGDGEITAKSYNEDVFKVELDEEESKIKISPISVGKSKIEVHGSSTDCCTEVVAYHDISIINGSITAQSFPAQGLIYDGQEHNLGYVQPSIDDCTIKYSVDGGEYKDEPVAINAGTHKINYIVAKQYFNDLTGIFDCFIDKAIPNLEFASVDTYKDNFPAVRTYSYSGDGVVSITSSDTNIIEASIEGTNVLVMAHNVGAAKLTLTAAEGKNYYSKSVEQTANVVGDIEYTIKFVSNCPLQIEDQIVHWGEKVEYIEPKYSGNTFIGWYLDEDFTTPYDFDTPVIDNFTLYAKWQLGEIIVTDNPNVVVDKEDLQKVVDQVHSENPEAKQIKIECMIDSENIPDNDKKILLNEIGKDDHNFYSIELYATVDEGIRENYGDKNKNIINMTYKVDISNMTNVYAHRVHNNKYEKFSLEGNSDQEKYSYDIANNKVKIEAMKYSTYAISYNDYVDPGPVDPLPDNDSASNISNTSDGINLFALCWLFVLSAFVACGSIIRLRKG